MSRFEYSDVVLNRRGEPRQGVAVAIKVKAGSAGSNTLFAGETGEATKAAVTDGNGEFSVWLEEGRYEVTFPNRAPRTIEAVVFGASTGGGGAPVIKEENLGQKSGLVELDLAKAQVFRVVAIGGITFQFKNIPANPTESSIIVTQDAVGGHTFTVENISWVGEEPKFSKVAEESAIATCFILEGGIEILGWGNEGGISLVGTTSATVTAFGEGAGPASLEPNTFFGIKAGTVTAAGARNAGFGEGVLQRNKTGSENIGAGYNSLANLESGSKNTAVGAESLVALKAGSEYTVFGFGAGAAATAGRLCAFGTWAGHHATTAENTTIMGFNAGFSLETGNSNSIFGVNASRENKVSNRNSVFGAGAHENGTGQENAIFGYKAAPAAGVGQKNTIMGVEAGLLLGAGVENTMIGYGAGATAEATGNGNVFIGCKASAAAGSNNLVIANANGYLLKGNFSANGGELVLGREAGRVALYGGVPVVQAATFAALGEAGTSTVKQLEEQSNKVRAVLKGLGAMA